MALSIAAPGRSELVIKKSRFIGMVCPVDNRQEALEIVERLRQEHPQATHVCWALMAGGESAAVDDGEPSGTAGRPMLEVLRHHDLEGVLATVVRYFGGVKLGAGGLVRAYTDAIAQAIQKTSKIERIRWCQLTCQIPYAFEGHVRRMLADFDAQIVDASHAEQVLLVIKLPQTHRESFVNKLEETCQGNISWQDKSKS